MGRSLLLECPFGATVAVFRCAESANCGSATPEPDSTSGWTVGNYARAEADRISGPASIIGGTALNSMVKIACLRMR